MRLALAAAALVALVACGTRSSLYAPEPPDATVLDASSPPSLRMDDAALDVNMTCTDARALEKCFAHHELEQAAVPNARWDENNCLPLDQFRDACCQPEFGPVFAWEETWGLQTCCYRFCHEACCGY
jgi:predicted small lipoprotein YifL